MTVIGVTVLTLALFGVKQHLDTQAAWNERFKRPKVKTPERPSVPFEIQSEDAIEVIQRVQRNRQRAEAELRERASWRCINGTPFRKIPGGWENVPGERC